MDETKNWEACREYYAAILVSIELGEEEWESNFRRFDNMLPRRVIRMAENRDSVRKDKTGERSERRRVPEIVFCKQYQRGNCTLQSPHWGRYKNEPNKVMMHHCCAKCILKDKVQRNHPEFDPECPNNNNNSRNANQ